MWRASSMLTAALIVFVYPFLYIVDGPWGATSIVLPGVLVLAILWLALPMVIVEVLHRRWRGLDDARQNAKTNRLKVVAARALSVAGVWFLLWIAVGV